MVFSERFHTYLETILLILRGLLPIRVFVFLPLRFIEEKSFILCQNCANERVRELLM